MKKKHLLKEAKKIKQYLIKHMYKKTIEHFPLGNQPKKIDSENPGLSRRSPLLPIYERNLGSRYITFPTVYPTINLRIGNGWCKKLLLGLPH